MSTGKARTALAPVHYQVSIPDPHSHLFAVTLTIAQPQAEQLIAAIQGFCLRAVAGRVMP